MNRVAKETAIATVIFAAVITVWRGLGDVFGIIVSSLTFALAYAAIGTAIKMYRNRDE